MADLGLKLRAATVNISKPSNMAVSDRRSMTSPKCVPLGAESSSLVVKDTGSSCAVIFEVILWKFTDFASSTDKQPAPAQQSSNPTAQETVARIVPAPPLVYSVLDFPKRTSAVMEINSSQTEYAAISYLPEKRQGSIKFTDFASSTDKQPAPAQQSSNPTAQ
ncbi:hypothetical protein JOQ06_005566, partial [Pogonophryne albipinna]